MHRLHSPKVRLFPIYKSRTSIVNDPQATQAALLLLKFLDSCIRPTKNGWNCRGNHFGTLR